MSSTQMNQIPAGAGAVYPLQRDQEVFPFSRISSEYLLNLINGCSDFVFKVMLVGESGAGKSSLMLRFADNNFDEVYISTIGVDFKFRTLKTRDKIVKLQIWDSAGQERFKTITLSYYRGAQAIIVVFDITDRNSFRSIERWMAQIRQHSSEDVPVMLIGNKTDLKAHRVVSTEEASALAKQMNMKYFETSAKDGSNVTEAFFAVTELLLDTTEQQKNARQKTIFGTVDMKKKGSKAKLSGHSNQNCCTII